ncbi:MAG: phosphotransferase [Rhodospirillales bacterium]|nr:phosphotransferase [Rhodospirillales bacterium]MCB9973022.1 phosphotransferase [Rhodospirillales bacterium]
MIQKTDWFADSAPRRELFLDREIPGYHHFEAMTHDMAPRFYHRVFREQQTFILLESAPDGHPQALPGHEIGAFLRVNRLLQAEGFSTPKIEAADEENGLVLLQDFGDLTFEKALKTASDEEGGLLYRKATDLLVALRAIPASHLSDLPAFEESLINRGVRRFADWFLPYYLGRSITDEDLAAFQEMMLALQKQLSPVSSGFIHGDFHPANLMILADGSLGILDFQGAMRGPSVYDLTNLLCDARRDVRSEWVKSCQSLYFSDAENGLIDYYNYLSLHFHLRVIGQFIKVAIVSGKTGYLQHLDRLRRYLQQSPVHLFQDYSRKAGLNWDHDLPPLSLDNLKKLIREDAT